MTAPCRAVLAVVLVATGCAGDGSQLGMGGMLDGDQATLAGIQQDVFSAICVNCHVPGGQASFLLLDSERTSAAQLIDQPSLEIPALLRVAPGDPDSSYLVWKIEGQGPNGEVIIGERMPPPSAGELPLTTEEIADIRQWILEGALP